MKNNNAVYRVGKFPQVTRRVYTTEQGLKSNEATALCFDKNGSLYVGTHKGLSRFDGDKFIDMPLGIKNADVSVVFCDENNHLFVGVGEKLIEFNGKKKVATRVFQSNVVDMKIDGDGVTWILTEQLLLRQPKGSADFDMEIGVPGQGSCLAVLRDNKVYVGTHGGGLHALVGKRWHWSELMAGMTGLLSDYVTCVDIDPAGNVWVGTDKGMCVYDDSNFWLDSSKAEGLPSANITGMAVAQNGDRYYSTTTGLIHQHNGKLTHYCYKRWLPDPHATAVAISEDGKVCVSTNAGISVFETKMMTLEEKANYLYEMTEKYNVRKDGYILGRDLTREGELSDDDVICNSDNDGLWTGLYLATLSFWYACTKEERIKASAQRSLKAMIKLTEITGKEGFTARAIRYPDERDYYTGARHEWHDAVDKEGNKLEWLGETSSDEMVGHMYGYSTYYDLVADDEEKALIRSVVKKILDHILENNFRLVDVDGLPTTWANWNPDLLNNDHKWMFEKGTNSLEILSFLKIGEHMLGDKKYTDAFNYLVSDKHYAMNLMQYRIPDGHLLHIDDNLCFLIVYPLMKYTTDPVLRSVFAMGLTHHWNEERVERNALFNFTYGAITGERFDVDNAVDELVDYPMDTISWSLFNSYRKDLKWDMSPIEQGMIPQLYEPLEAHNRRIVYSDGNRFVADSGVEELAEAIFNKGDGPDSHPMFPGTGDDKGLNMQPGTTFLQPYWLARYHGLIED